MIRYGQLGAEPFEEQWRGKNASRDTVNLGESSKLPERISKDKERDSLTRKTSGKRRSLSIWRRKSTKEKSELQPPHPNPSSTSLLASEASSIHRVPSNEREMQAIEEAAARERVDLLPSPHSVVPDAITEVPSWYAKDHTGPASHKSRFKIHNPVGPRWYKNHHLIPPGATATTRPSSYFSPDFPPMASSSSVRLEDYRIPHPTPASSASPSRAEPATKPRSRKVSQTTADNVDMLDASDPWGQNFHHSSPYDISGSDGPEGQGSTSQTRSRHSSVTVPSTQKHRSVNPSPLSQSTSAVHLHPESALDIDSNPGTIPRIPRRLSKRRTPVLGFFAGRPAPGESTSAPTTPLPTSPEESSKGKRLSKATGPPLSNPAAFSAAVKKDRRGSVLGRLARKFSLSRKPSKDSVSTSPQEHQNTQMEDRRSVSEGGVQMEEQVSQPGVGASRSRSPSPLKVAEQPETPAPHVVPPEPTEEKNSPPAAEASAPPPRVEVSIGRNSMSSLEELSFSIGKLTVANPDLPSVANTPMQRDSHLPSPPPPALHEPVPSPGPSNLTTRTPFPRDEDPKRTVPPTPIPTDSHTPISSPTKLKKKPTKLGTPSPEKPSRPDEETKKSPLVARKPIPHDTPSSRPVALNRVQGSPESSSSLLVNPPTPAHPAVLDLPPTPGTPAPPLPKKDPPRKSREPSPGNLNRSTETFKLIRSASGNVYASSETIRAAGAQWEVVESEEKRRKESRSGSKESLPSKKERRKSHRNSSQDNPLPRHQLLEPSASSSKKGARSSSEHTSDDQTNRRSTSSSKRRSDLDRGRQPGREAKSRGSSEMISVAQSMNHSSHLAANYTFERERPSSSSLQPSAPSLVARPNSELVSSRELTDTRAREAWELERLYRGRSMYGAEKTEIPPSPSTVAPTPPPKESSLPPIQTHGSSYTSFVMQTSFQGNPASPSRPPRFSRQHSMSREDVFIGPNNNPLPLPPQESAYRPSNIRGSDPKSAETWAEYVGMMT